MTTPKASHPWRASVNVKPHLTAVQAAAAQLGRIKSHKKAEASRRNGKLGGYHLNFKDRSKPTAQLASPNILQTSKDN